MRPAGGVPLRITARTVARDPVTGCASSAELVYDPTRPFEVELVFYPDADRVRWAFARDLLAAGLHAPAGEGDIRVSPVGEDYVQVYLESDVGASSALLDSAVVATFLVGIYARVPVGAETLPDLDAELRKLLKEGLR